MPRKKSAKKKDVAEDVASTIVGQILDDQKQADPEVLRLQRHIAGLENQLAETGNAERDGTVLKLRQENNKLRGGIKAAHHELNIARGREELHAGLSDPMDLVTWRKGITGTGAATAIVALSDWHVEETIEPDKVNYLNEFNLDIADARIERTFQKIIYMMDIARKMAKIDELVIWLGGDFITGYIHEELEESNALSPLEASKWVQSRIVSGLKFLRKHARAHIIVPTSHGNHGRTTKKKRISTAAENSYEYSLYGHIADQFAGDPKIKFKIERGYHNHLDVQGRNVRFHHGDALKYGGGIGGLTVPTNRAVAQWNKSVVADLDVFGHFHQFLPCGRRWVCNGSLVGYSPYAVNIKAEYEVPSQTFILIDKHYGNVMTAPIFCTELSS